MATDHSSQELLTRYCRGDDQAAVEIFDRYVLRLLELARRRISPLLARRVDADDVVQSAYRSFFVHALRGEFAVRRAGDLWRLLAAIALNKLQHQIERHTAGRRDIRQETHSTDGTEERRFSHVFAVEPTADEAAAVADQLQTMLRRCAPLQRNVVEMRLQGHTVEEIAEHVGRSQRTVRRLLDGLRREWETEFRSP